MAVNDESDRVARLSEYWNQELWQLDTPGHRATDAHFLKLVTNSASSVHYSSGGVRVEGAVRTTDGAVAMGKATDATVTSGEGMMVVNSKSDGTGKIFFLRAGLYAPNDEGLFVHSDGRTLVAWPLDNQGRLGVSDNHYTQSKVLMDSLVPVSGHWLSASSESNDAAQGANGYEMADHLETDTAQQADNAGDWN
jgi:flagellar hook protein FlgE